MPNGEIKSHGIRLQPVVGKQKIIAKRSYAEFGGSKMSLLSRVPVFGVLKTCRGLSLSSRLSPRNHHTKSKSRIMSYMSSKYVSLKDYYENKLSKKFPLVYAFYRRCTEGLKLYKADASTLYKSYKKVKSQGLCSLTRRELEVYHQMPKDIMKSAPIVIVGAGIPFCGFVFIIAFYFPRQMLTHHFWTVEQRKEFAIYDHQKKVQHFNSVYYSLEKLLPSLEDNPLQDGMKEILECLGRGIRPDADLILSCKPLFENTPYSLCSLSRRHIVDLLCMHHMHRGWRRRKRLELRACILKLTDDAILREGGVEKLKDDEIRWICFFRGLNPMNMTRQDIVKWMNTWLTISQQIDKKSYSLLLHCPILLGSKRAHRSC